jgi:YegS/Rv2252/BmrU family lipid kinase
MTSQFGPIVVIADPTAGHGAVHGRIPEVESELARRGLEFRLVRAGGPYEVAAAAREAIASGGRFLVVVGDDRTVHHAVNGLIDDDRPIAPDAILGVVPAGSRSDFVQTFGLPHDVARACSHLEGPNLFPIDVGKVTCMDPASETRIIRYFPNLSQAGLGAEVARKISALPSWTGRGKQFLAFWLALPRFQAASVTIRAGDRHFDGTAHNLFVANGQYYGGGQRISPRSWPGDGLLDVLVMTGPKSEAFTLLPKIFRGEHLPHRHIVVMKARSVTLETERPWPVEADGEFLGTTPATFDVIRQPIRLKI